MCESVGFKGVYGQWVGMVVELCVCVCVMSACFNSTELWL